MHAEEVRSLSCRLCDQPLGDAFWRDKRRPYHRCERCQMIQVPPQAFVRLEDEKSEYDLHQNEIHDAGYRRFLNRMFQPMQARISPCAQGLDFGCGPGPALATMFQEAGHEVALYDLFYFNDASAWDRVYDFITATEVVEHLHHPRAELDQLAAHIKPGGYLGVMTKLSTGEADFPHWHYKNDRTHVSFFAWESFEYLAAQWGWALEQADKDVVILQKPV